MECLSQRFKESGFPVSTVSQHSFYGWSFGAQIENRKFWFLIQGGSPWLLIVKDCRSVLRRVFDGDAPFLAALKVCDSTLQALGHISGIEWLTQAAYEARGRAKYKQRNQPNKAAEPTRTSGTPPADAGGRASGARGSP